MKRILIFLLGYAVCWASEPEGLPRRQLERAFPEAERFETLTDAEAAGPFFVARSRKGILGACAPFEAAEERPDGKEVHTFLACANPNGKIVGVFPGRVGRKALAKPVFLRQFRGVWPEDLGKISFPRGIPLMLAQGFRSALGKTSKAIDRVIPP